MKTLDVYSASEAARLLAVDRLEVITRVKHTGIPHKRVGNSIVINGAGLARLRRECQTRTNEAATT